MAGVLRGIAGAIFFLGYPFLVYQGMEKGVVWFAPLLISSVYLYQGFKAQDNRSRINKIAVAVVLLVGAIFFSRLLPSCFPSQFSSC